MSQFREPAAPPLAYATPAPRAVIARPILRISIAAIIALLTADSLASAMGASPVDDFNRNPLPYFLRILMCAIVFALVFSAILPLVRLTRGTVERIARSPVRPSPAAALSLIFCGTACILAALAVEVYLVRYGSTIVSAMGTGDSINSSQHFSVGVQPPLFGHLVTVATFLAGAALCALGAWGSSVRSAAA
jgi:hypothetical protein